MSSENISDLENIFLYTNPENTITHLLLYIKKNDKKIVLQ